MDIAEAKAKMERSLEYFRGENAKVRGGRANPGLIEEIKVEVYESLLPIKQLGTVNVVDPTLITVQCWDKNCVDTVKKSIEDSDLNVNPSVDGSIVRVPLPSLTQERREELVKIVKKLAEDAKVAVRRIRREFLDSLEKESESEDEMARGKKEVQRLIKEINKSIDDEFEAKQKELLTI